jgi:hypothetical protein
VLRPGPFCKGPNSTPIALAVDPTLPLWSLPCTRWGSWRQLPDSPMAGSGPLLAEFLNSGRKASPCLLETPSMPWLKGHGVPTTIAMKGICTAGRTEGKLPYIVWSSEHIGRALTRDEIVHHRDHDPENNAIENL